MALVVRSVRRGDWNPYTTMPRPPDHIILRRLTVVRLVVRATRTPRDGWETAARAMRAAGDELLDPPSANAFDEREWEW